MNYTLALPSNVAQNILFNNASTLKKLALLLGGVVTLAIASQLSIPLHPVPLTFQSATVILLAMAYGARHSTYVIGTYLIAGLCGLPVFADFSSGMATLQSPSMGYLLGFLPAAFICGTLADHGFGRHAITGFITALLGATIIFGCGLPVLATFIGWKQAIALGLMPFIASELIKLAAVSLVIPRLWKKS